MKVVVSSSLGRSWGRWIQGWALENFSPCILGWPDHASIGDRRSIKNRKSHLSAQVGFGDIMGDLCKSLKDSMLPKFLLKISVVLISVVLGPEKLQMQKTEAILGRQFQITDSWSGVSRSYADCFCPISLTLCLDRFASSMLRGSLAKVIRNVPTHHRPSSLAAGS